MARTGSFGRLPRVAPNLSSTILAMLREYNSTIDSNMVDAWNNGGEVDGKPVTDERLLAHFKMRRDAISKDDPLWAMWDERIDQYSYAIEESKMTVRWDNGKASISQMAGFYKKWMGKTPADSQFGRTLASAYGKWMKSGAQRSGGGGGGAAAKAAAHYKWEQTYYDNNLKGVHTATAWLPGLLKDLGATGGMGFNGDLPNTEAGGYDEFETLLAVVEGGGLQLWQQQRVNAYVADMKKIDPTFRLDIDWFTGAASKADRAIDTLVSKSRTKADGTRWAKLGGEISTSVNRIKSAPVVADYRVARTIFDAELAAAQGDPTKVLAATKNYHRDIGRFMESMGITTRNGGVDEAVYQALAAERNFLGDALAGKQLTGDMPPTILDSSGGGSQRTGEDSSSWQAGMNNMNLGLDRIKAGGWVSIDPTDVIGDYQYVVHDVSEIRPAGYDLVPGMSVAGGAPVYTLPVPLPMVVVGPDKSMTKAQPVKTDGKGTPLDQFGMPIDPNNPLDAEGKSRYVAATDVETWMVTIPDAEGDVVLYKGFTASGVPFYMTHPPINPESSGDVIVQADGQPKIQIDSSIDAAGSPWFNPHEHLVYETVVYQNPGRADADPLHGMLKVEYRGVPPVTQAADGSWDVQPGYFLTPTAAKLYFDLTTLSGSGPEYTKKFNAIMTEARDLPLSIAKQIKMARAGGDAYSVNELTKAAQAAESDWVNMKVAAVAVQSGDASSLAQAKVAESLIGSSLDWTAETGTTVVRDNKVASAADVGLAGAKTWARMKVADYEKGRDRYGPWGASAPAGALPVGLGPYPESLPKTSATNQLDLGLLKSRIDAATDPSQIKLPGFVTDIPNPYLPKRPDPMDAIRNNPDPRNPWRAVAAPPVPATTAIGATAGALKPATPPKPPAEPPVPKPGYLPKPPAYKPPSYTRIGTGPYAGKTVPLT